MRIAQEKSIFKNLSTNLSFESGRLCTGTFKKYQELGIVWGRHKK